MYTRLVRSPGTNTNVIKILIDKKFALHLLSYNSFAAAGIDKGAEPQRRKKSA